MAEMNYSQPKCSVALCNYVISVDVLKIWPSEDLLSCVTACPTIVEQMVSRPLFLACGIPASPANGSSVATAETALKHSVLPPLRSDGTTLAFSCGDVRVAEKRERLRNAQTDPSIVQIRRNDCFSASHL